MKRKLRSRSGETILEVLIACMIGFFAVLMLSEMIAASSKLIAHGREDMNDYRKDTINFVNTINSDGTGVGEVVFAYNRTNDDPSGTLTAVRISGASSDGNLAVKFAASDDSGERRVVSYWR